MQSMIGILGIFPININIPPSKVSLFNEALHIMALYIHGDGTCYIRKVTANLKDILFDLQGEILQTFPGYLYLRKTR